MSATLADLAEEWDLVEPPPSTPLQRQWHDNGLVILRGFADETMMAAYEAEWRTHNIDRPGGWDYATPYMDHLALRSLVCDGPLGDTLESLLGEPAGVHLNLTGWRSTRRNWHTDQYLNEPYVGPFYAAVWLALGTIHPDAGPFQYLPGSHRWFPPISQAKMRTALGPDGDGPSWPKHSERILTPLFEAELAERDVEPTSFLAERGDVLIWHSRLLHRGSIPVDETVERRALISHYSGIHHRPDMPPAVQCANGGWFFPLGGRQPV